MVNHIFELVANNNFEAFQKAVTDKDIKDIKDEENKNVFHFVRNADFAWKLLSGYKQSAESLLNERDKAGRTPLQTVVEAVQTSVVETGQGFEHLVQAFIEHGANFDEQVVSIIKDKGQFQDGFHEYKATEDHREGNLFIYGYNLNIHKDKNNL